MPIKDEELKDFVSEFLDIDVENVEDVETLKNTFSDIFARKETFKAELLKDSQFVGKVTGKTLGSIATKIKQVAKEDFGLEFDRGEFSDKTTPEEFLSLLATKAKSKYETEINEAKSKVTEPNKAIEALEEKLKLKAQEAETWKTQASTIGTEYEGFKNTIAQKEKEHKKETAFNDVWNKIDFAAEADDLKKKGFKTTIFEEVDFNFDESGKFLTFDKQGNALPNPKKSGQFYEPAEYLKDKAIEARIYKNNSDGGKPVNQRFTTQADQSDEKPKYVHPNAQ